MIIHKYIKEIAINRKKFTNTEKDNIYSINSCQYPLGFKAVSYTHLDVYKRQVLDIWDLFLLNSQILQIIWHLVYRLLPGNNLTSILLKTCLLHLLVTVVLTSVKHSTFCLL